MSEGKSFLFPLTKWVRFGDYPFEYDPEKHGPYNPSKYYGKQDTPFGDVKLRELLAWFGRRKKGPREFTGLLSRAFWRWQIKWVQPIRSTPAPLYQVAFMGCVVFYTINYPRIRGHANFKYH